MLFYITINLLAAQSVSVQTCQMNRSVMTREFILLPFGLISLITRHYMQPKRQQQTPLAVLQNVNKQRRDDCSSYQRSILKHLILNETLQM